MSSLTLRRLGVMTLTMSLVIALLPVKAHACSCAGDGPDEMLARADAAFLGTLVGRSGGLFGGNATWTFEAQEWVKGNLGPTVKIRSAASGAACGFELEPGDDAAIFVQVDGDTFTGGLCSTLDADALRAHLRPQRVVATSATILVAAAGSQRHLWLFDDRGRLAGASADSRGEWLEDLSLCRRGRSVVELWEGGRIVVRNLSSLRAARTLQGPRNLARVWCRDAAGTQLLGARRSNVTGDLAAIVDLRRPERPLVSGEWVDAEVVGTDLVAAVGREDTQLRKISLVNGRAMLLHQAVTPVEEVSVAASIEGFAISADQTRVAFEVTNYPREGEPSSEVFVRDLATRRLLGHRHVPSEGAQVAWLDKASLLFTSYEDETLVLGLPDLELLHTLPEQAHWPVMRTAGGDLVGTDGPRLTAIDPSSGRVDTLATISAEHSSRVLPLPRPVDMRVPLGRSSPSEEPRPGATLPPAPMPRPMSPVVPAAAAAALAAALAVAFVAIRRRPRRF